MNSAERRKYPRFNAHIPIDISLFDLKGGKITQAKFKGVTTDISMEGLGLEMNYPASDMLSFAPKLIGKNKEFDLYLNANLGTGGVKGVGEVRWGRIHLPSSLKVLKMGVFLKQMRDDEKEKWTNLVTSQTERLSRHVSRLRAYNKDTSKISLPRLMRDLITSPSSINYALPAALITSPVIIYWLVQATFWHGIIPCGISIAVILLTKSRIFSRYPKPRYEIPQWFLRKFCRKLRGDVPRSSPK